MIISITDSGEYAHLAMATYLEDNPPARSQYRRPRREALSGVVVVHTAENTPDFVAFDGGAEAVANFIRGRSDPGSYHDLADSDSAIAMVPWDWEAYQDGTGSNPHAIGISVATRADVWPLAPKAWRDGAIRQIAKRAAAASHHVMRRRGFHVPARRISRAQSEARMPGFISHAERDPGRRSDPGAGFPWDQFFREYEAALGGTTAPKEWWEDMDAATREAIGDEVTERLRAFLPAVVGHLEQGGSNKVVNPGLTEWKFINDPRAVTLRDLADGNHYYGKSAEGASSAVYVILGSHVGKLHLTPDLWDWVKALSSLAGRAVKVEAVPDAVLAGIPDLGPAARPPG